MTTTFANSFWSADYAGGLGVLFGKLQQGVQENQQVLTVARMRAEAEELYGAKLGDITSATDRISGGFGRDDGASVRKAYDGVRAEMEEASKNHRKIASNIRELVVNPFSRWCEAHAGRIQNSQDLLQSRVRHLDKQTEAVRKLRSAYYNKCRVAEDLEEEDKLAFQDPQNGAQQSPKQKQKVPSIKEPEDDEDEPVDLGGVTYEPEQVKKILTHMLDTIKLGEAKVPILGTYQNVSTGSAITEYIQKHLNASNVDYAEEVGQDLINNGFLRLIGSVGNTFTNSSRINYQWKPKVFQITGVPANRKPLERVSSIMSTDSTTAESPTSAVSSIDEYLQRWNPLNNPHPNETPAERLKREAREADEKYKDGVRKLDGIRCQLEEDMFTHLKFMERCELDRLKAIKAVILDFSGAVSNVIPSLQSTVDQMMLFQETVQPLGDLRYLLENYRTGPFLPRVIVYENYYNSVDEQTFGVDLEARARSDRKRVPIIVTTILMFLDNHYPDLEGDEARRGIWLVDVPLQETHRLREKINTGKPIDPSVLEDFDLPVVAAVLKLYLLELPDSLVSSHVYEIVKTIYNSGGPTTTSDSARITIIQSTLGQLRLANIATLDALTTHLYRLIDLTSADEEYIATLASSLAPCILRPRQESSLTMTERWNYRLLRDLLAHKDAIFGELKRQSSASHAATARPPSIQATAPGSDSRPRAISTDESNRRANFEERQRAIRDRSRASSPAPSPRVASFAQAEAGAARGHRRDRSVGGPETRFPVNTGAQGGSPTERRQTASRHSLEVPGSSETSPNEVQNSAAAAAAAAAATRGRSDTNGTVTGANGTPAAEVGIEKRDSRGRAPAASRFSRKAPPGGLQRQSVLGSGAPGDRSSVASLSSAAAEAEQAAAARPVGVELTDKPMDLD